MKKVLNLYAGIGGNRKLWTDVEVTAVEMNPDIAKLYQDFFPDDTVIVADAHQYLLDHYADDWDFIWSSPPCPTHSKIYQVFRKGNGKSKNPAVYPNMMLYEEIIFLTHNIGNGKFCVENVESYYDPLIKPQHIGRHYYWANFIIPNILKYSREHCSGIEVLQKVKQCDLTQSEISNKRQILRNCVEPFEGKHIFDMAFRCQQTTVKEWEHINDRL